MTQDYDSSPYTISILGEKPHSFPVRAKDYTYARSLGQSFVSTYTPDKFEIAGVNAILEKCGSLDKKNYDKGFMNCNDLKDCVAFMANDTFHQMVSRFLSKRSKEEKADYLASQGIRVPVQF